MAASLRLVATVAMPPGRSGGFDHGDVDRLTGQVFVAHTAFGTVDVIDPESFEAQVAMTDCPEGSGLICASADRVVFAASRGGAKVIEFAADDFHIIRTFNVGPKPNGLAWDPGSKRLLVADVDQSDQLARLIEITASESAIETALPGRPRWCVFD